MRHPHPKRGGRLACHWVSYDGSYGYQIHFFDGDPTRADRVYRTREVPPLARNDLFVSFMLLKTAGGGRMSPVDIVRSAVDPPTGLYIAPDASTAYLSSHFPIPRPEGGVGNTLILRFRPDHDGWPIAASIQPAVSPGHSEAAPVDKPLKSNDELFRRFEILSFQNINDPLLGQPRKFPERIRWSSITAPQIVHLVEVRVNGDLPASLFRPQLPIGTLVTDEQNTPSEKRMVVGGKAGEDFRVRMVNERKMKSKQVALASQTAEPIVAVPTQGRMRDIFLAIFSALALAALTLWLKPMVFSR